MGHAKDYVEICGKFSNIRILRILLFQLEEWRKLEGFVNYGSKFGWGNNSKNDKALIWEGEGIMRQEKVILEKLWLDRSKVF